MVSKWYFMQLSMLGEEKFLFQKFHHIKLWILQLQLLQIEHRIVGIRPGEKLHEEMIAESDSFYTYDIGKYYTILPSKTNWDINDYIKQNK